MQPSAPPARPAPVRVLGVFDTTCVVVGAIIGVGIFFNPSKVAALAGSEGLALTAWAVGGVIALCGAITFAQLGMHFFASGAQYRVLREAYGPLPAFLFVFCNATAIQAGAIAVIAVVCAEHLFRALRGTPPDSATVTVMALAIIAGLALANILGVRWGSRIQNVTVLAKVATLCAVVGIAVFATPAVAAEPAPVAQPGALGPVSGILAALVPAFFAFGGWQQALWISGEVKEPRKTLPRGILAGVVLVVAVYLLANWAYFHLLGYRGVVESKALAADSVATVMAGVAGRVVAGAVAVSALGVLNSSLLTGPRLIFAMAEDGRFFAPFGRVNQRTRTPVWAILLLGALGCALLLAAGVERADRLVTGTVFIDGVFFVLTGLAWVLLRGRVAKDAAGRIPGATIAAVLFVVGELGVVTGSYLDAGTRSAALLGVAWIAGAAVVYAIWFRRKVTAPAAPPA